MRSYTTVALASASPVRQGVFPVVGHAEVNGVEGELLNNHRSEHAGTFDGGGCRYHITDGARAWRLSPAVFRLSNRSTIIALCSLVYFKSNNETKPKLTTLFVTTFAAG